jgi:hypothetical protein
LADKSAHNGQATVWIAFWAASRLQWKPTTTVSTESRGAEELIAALTGILVASASSLAALACAHGPSST